MSGMRTARGMRNLIFVDGEAMGPCPGLGERTEFGAVAYASRATFHGVLAGRRPHPEDSTRSEPTGERLDRMAVFSAFAAWLPAETDGRRVFVSDNPAFDWQWINHGFHHAPGRNPFGHSARRIGDFYADLVGDFGPGQRWKRLRRTRHDHPPVHDGMGNVEAFERMLNGGR